jgi:hypothetical protein
MQHTTKKQIALRIGGLDTKKDKAKGASATHNREKKIYCVLGGLDTKNIVEGRLV